MCQVWELADYIVLMYYRRLLQGHPLEGSQAHNWKFTIYYSPTTHAKWTRDLEILSHVFPAFHKYGETPWPQHCTCNIPTSLMPMSITEKKSLWQFLSIWDLSQSDISLVIFISFKINHIFCSSNAAGIDLACMQR